MSRNARSRSEMANDQIRIPWPLSNAPGGDPQESAGRLFNCDAEPLGKENPSGTKWTRCAGLSTFANLGVAGFRGGILVGSLAYIAVGTSIVTVNSSGTVNTAGALPGSDQVTFARDNETPPAIQCVSPSQGAFSVTSGSVTSFNGGGVLPAPTCVWSQDGYFFWGIGDNRVFAAGPNSTTVNALTFTTIQSRSTGNLLRGVPYQGLSYIFAQNFCEVWADTAQPFPAFPYSRYAVIDRGLFGANAIAGYQDGFGQLYWVGDDCAVYGLNGVAPQKVSPPDLDRMIQGVPQASAASLQASCYIANGKPFWSLSYGTNWTWEFNINTGKWKQRESWNAGQFQAWRASGTSLLAFDRWLMGDTLSNNLLYVDPTTQQECGNPLRMRMESAPVKEFPKRSTIARADFDFVVGVGQNALTTQTGQSPQVAISCSRDGGLNWDPERICSLGKQAHTIARVYATRFGQATNHGPRFRIDLSDEVYASFMGATCSDRLRAS